MQVRSATRLANAACWAGLLIAAALFAKWTEGDWWTPTPGAGSMVHRCDRHCDLRNSAWGFAAQIVQPRGQRTAILRRTRPDGYAVG